MVRPYGELAKLFRRDLRRLRDQVEAFPEDALLWQTLPGVTNPAGTLVLHLEGNLREYVGRQLGGEAYSRDRAMEFSARDLAKSELLRRVDGLIESVPPILESLSAERGEVEYPQLVLEVPLSTGAFLMHLYGHLSWHTGQIDSLRRALTTQGALERVSL